MPDEQPTEHSTRAQPEGAELVVQEIRDRVHAIQGLLAGADAIVSICASDDRDIGADDFLNIGHCIEAANDRLDLLTNLLIDYVDSGMRRGRRGA